MQSTSPTRKARELSPDQRQAVEGLLGRVLQEDENVSVVAFQGNVIQAAPTGQARQEAYNRLRVRIDETALRAEGVSDFEINAAIDEAVEFVRHQSLNEDHRRYGDPRAS